MANNALIAGISFIGLAIVSTCGYFLYEGMKTTSLVTLKELPLYTTGESKNKFGGIYSYYFLSTEEGHNESLWLQRVEAFKEDTEKSQLVSSSYFDNIKSSISTESLKKTCSEKYKADQAANDDDEKQKEIWRYCSIKGSKLLTLSNSSDKLEKSNSTDSGGAWNGKSGGLLKDKLISVKSKENNWFWDIRDKQFINKELNLDSTKDKFFVDQRQQFPAKKLRDICFDAFAKEKTATDSEVNSGKILENTLLRLCSVSKETTTTSST